MFTARRFSAVPPSKTSQRQECATTRQQRNGVKTRRTNRPAKESLNNPNFVASRGRGGLDLKLDDFPGRPGATFVAGYGANGRYPCRSAAFAAVPPAPGGLLPCHCVA